jgi:hypothetical protein
MTSIAAILTALSLMSIGGEWLKGSKRVEGWYVSVAVSLGTINLAWAVGAHGLALLHVIRLVVYGRAIVNWNRESRRRRTDPPGFEPPRK